MAYSRTKPLTLDNVDDVVLQGVLTVLENRSNHWTGTMTELNTLLSRYLGKTISLPRSPSALRTVLNRVVNRLRSRGVSVKFGRTPDHSRSRFVIFCR